MVTVAGFWRIASLEPGRVATVDPDGTPVKYGALRDRVNRVSHALIGSGIGAGDGLAIFASNRSDVLAVMLAASQIGAYFTMLSNRLASPEAAYILSDSKPSLIFVDKKTASAARDALRLAELSHLPRIGFDADVGSPTLDAWSASHSTREPATRSAGAPMLYTSGTSGRPKGVRPQLTGRPPEEHLPSLTRLLTQLGIEVDNDAGMGVHLVTSPLYHAAPMYKAWLALHLGHTVVIMDRFDPARSLELIESHQVTWTQVVPTMMHRWMELNERKRLSRDMSSLRWVIHAGAPCPIELKRRILDWLGPIVYEYYSSTEGGGTAIGPLDWLSHPGSVGRPWPGASVRILDDDRNEVPPGTTGNIFFLNTRRFEYHNDPRKTLEAQHGDYMTVGDLGWTDEDGYLYLTDRRTDLILAGGVNVYPAEVEAAIRQHPGISDVAVIGIPDIDLGQAVHAVVQPAVGSNPEGLILSLHAICAQLLGSHKRPRSIELRPTLPRSDAGKLLRQALRDEYAARQPQPPRDS